jgi:putative ABC transport system permease protein
LRPTDLLSTGLLGLRSRPVRALLSALGVAIGVAAVVAVLGVTRSSQSHLLAQLDSLGTNLLTVTNGQDRGASETVLPPTATAMIRQVGGVESVAPTARLTDLAVYRNDRVPAGQTGGRAVRAADAALLTTLDGTLAAGRFLGADAYPATVLGHDAARTLGVAGVGGPERVWIGDRWFTVVGVLAPLPLAPEIDQSALVSFPAARALLGYAGDPSRLYLRTDPDRVAEVAGLLAAAANPVDPGRVGVRRPSDALTAQVAATEAGAALYLGLGAIALLVGAIGIANVMVVAVLERRTEIGLRRALGATRAHVAAQFVTESLVLSAVGGVGGVLLGVAVTGVLCLARGWVLLVPPAAGWGGVAVALLAGGLAGLYPAVRAARLPPVDALRTA